MKRKRRILRLKLENRRLRKENKQLHDKHWSECRQIALYGDGSKKLKRTDAIHDFARMCNSYCDCAGCPMRELRNGFHGCDATMRNYPEKVSEVVSKWCAEHPETPEGVSEQPEEPEKPKKTYKEDFLEKFPNTFLKDSDIPWTCRDNAYGIQGPCENRGCVNCWNEVMPDE